MELSHLLKTMPKMRARDDILTSIFEQLNTNTAFYMQLGHMDIDILLKLP